MPNALSDFRYAARQLRRRWGFTGIAVLTLALGIGGASAVLAIEHALTPNPNQVADVDGVFSPIYRNPPNPLPLPAIRTVEQLRAFEVTPPPPLTILAIGLAAAFVPARRAARVDPNVTLREL